MSGIDLAFTQTPCTRCELFDTNNKLNRVQRHSYCSSSGDLKCWDRFEPLYSPCEQLSLHILLLYINSLQQFS